jgi:AcrR family transcriptional regulator
MTEARPLSRDVVLGAAVALADEDGIESLSMRKLGQRIGVEAMSLYNHVRNKDDLLAGMVDVVVSEFGLPGDHPDWRDSIRPIAEATRSTLLRHPWAAVLVQSHMTPSEVRVGRADAVIGTFREAGFSIELAYKAQLAIESFVYGFVLQEVNWPFEPEQQSAVAANLKDSTPVQRYPYLAEMLDSIMTTRRHGQGGLEAGAYKLDFEFGLELLLDGLETIRLNQKEPSNEAAGKNQSIKE